MKKKIMIGLGALTAVAAPVVGLISCGDSETIADKLISIYPDKITIPAADGSNTEVVAIKAMGVNSVLNDTDAGFKYIMGLIPNNKTKMDDLKKKDSDVKSFVDKLSNKITDETLTTLKSTFTVKKALADNKMTFTLKLTASDTIPEIKSRGTASKDVEIIFATA